MADTAGRCVFQPARTLALPAMRRRGRPIHGGRVKAREHLVQARVQALEHCFAHIADTRMRGVPVQNLHLRVQAVDFASHLYDGEERLLGVLVTPWFMGLVRLPLSTQAPALAVGHKCLLPFGAQQFEFIGANEAGIGAYESCSLFSPMFEFADQAAAVDTAAEVLKLLRQPAPKSDTPSVPGRRGFLLGRSATREARV